MKAVFLDRDGTLIADPPDLRVESIDEVHPFHETLQALHKLAGLNFGVFLITNQAGIGEGLLTEEEFLEINDYFVEMIEPTGIKILKTYFCPHTEQAHCACRKPKPTMLLQAAKEFDVELSKSWMIGDRESDIMAGVNAGAKTILVQTGNIPVSSKEADFTASNLLEAVDYIQKHSQHERN